MLRSDKHTQEIRKKKQKLTEARRKERKGGINERDQRRTIGLREPKAVFGTVSRQMFHE